MAAENSQGSNEVVRQEPEEQSSSSRALDTRTSVQKKEKYRFAANIPDDKTAPEREYANYIMESDRDDAKIPDVLLDVPVVKVDEINFELNDLRVRANLFAKVLDLVELAVGVDAYLGRVKLVITGVEVQALLKVRLDNVAAILDRVLTTIDRNPQIVERLVEGVSSAIEDVGAGAGSALTDIGQGAGQLVGEGLNSAVADIGEGAGALIGEGLNSAVADIGAGAGSALEDIGQGAGQLIGEGLNTAGADIGGGGGFAGEEIGGGGGGGGGSRGRRGRCSGKRRLRGRGYRSGRRLCGGGHRGGRRFCGGGHRSGHRF